jgi:hypothetical protein
MILKSGHFFKLLNLLALFDDSAQSKNDLAHLPTNWISLTRK